MSEELEFDSWKRQILLRWSGHVARMGEKRHGYRLLVESQRERGR
jgi:hypothetical protein